MKTVAAALAATVLLTAGAFAAEGDRPGAQDGQMPPGQMQQRMQGGMMQGGMGGMEGMMRGMPRMDMAEQLGASGDIDSDFVRMMTPHHQEAMAMARKQVAEGKDPELKKMAEKMLKGQEQELSEMQDWAKRHGKQQVQ